MELGRHASRGDQRLGGHGFTSARVGGSRKQLIGEIMDLVGEVPTDVIVKKIRSTDVDELALVGHLAFNAKCASQDLDAHPVEPADREQFYAILDLIMALGGYTAA